MEWKDFYRHVNPAILDNLLPASEWQEELADLIDKLNPGLCMEAGSGYGVTSLLLKTPNRRILLDIEMKPLLIARELFERQRQRAHYVSCDISAIASPSDTYDVVFNAGVLEHFVFEQRKKILSELIRVTKRGGYVVLAVPNHFSTPYRFSYEYRKKKDAWPYPDEEKIFDFSEEIKGMDNIGSMTRHTICPGTSYVFLKGWQRIIFRIIGLFKEYEGYLSVITLKKI
jgi:ubiquinone/menaquinone biosynthesis C-methylase UbiE